MEEKKTKKTTTTKKTNTKAKTATKKEALKAVVEQPQVQAQPSMEQMFQMFQMFMNQQVQQQPQSKSVEEKKTVNKRTNGKLNKSTLRRERGDEDVLVRSVAGCVCFKSPKTGVTYNFLEKGDEEWLTVDEVLQMETANRKFLHTPWLVVEDDEVNEVLGLKEISETVSELTDNLDEILEEYDIKDIEDLVSRVPEDYKKTFAGVVLEKINNKELRDGVVISELGRMLNIDFSLYTNK
ncbi:MAG: hypothetical protein II309_08630 [Bacilli bacterium]|nr:hypothetical protein [Bacilli bacterium]